MTSDEKELLEGFVDTLGFYADPETYHAIGMVADEPCGDFAQDIDEVEHPMYDEKPGKKAREFLKKNTDEILDILAEL